MQLLYDLANGTLEHLSHKNGDFPSRLLLKKKKKTGKLDRSVLSSFTCNSHNTGISLDVFQLATG